MKLLLKFSGFDSDDQVVVDYDGDLKDFPPYGKYDGRFWQAILYDEEEDTGIADMVMVLGEHKESALPMTILGKQVHVTDLEVMFNIKGKLPDPCSCGAKFTSFPTLHMIYCPQWKKQ